MNRHNTTLAPARSGGSSHAGPRCRSLLLPALVAVALAAICIAVTCFAEIARAAPATVVRTGPPAEPGNARRIALTFDDNFRPELSIPLLSYLRENQVRATLFVTAVFVERYPDLTAEMAAGQTEGWFEIGDHSATHPFLTQLAYPDLLAEVGAGGEAYERMTGKQAAPLLRPPYGHVNDRVLMAAGERGLRYVVLWDLDTSDWTGISAETIATRVISGASDGTIVLMHMSAEHTLEAVPIIVVGLRNLGYELVTVGDLLRNGRKFVDVGATTPGAEAIGELVDAGVMNGYDDFFFGPTDAMTRAQVAKVAVLAGGLHTEEPDNLDDPTFVDVRAEYDLSGALLPYPLDYVEEAVAAGLVAGLVREDGSRVFLPDQQITRVQLAQIVARMARELKGYPAVPFEGPAPYLGDVPAHAREDVAMVAHLGIMNGYGNGRFDPYSSAMRGHVAAVIARFLYLPLYQSAEPSPLPEPIDE